MALKTPNHDDEILADINLTPLIDIMLVLLIIFMVTSSLSVGSGLDIDLPKSNSVTEGQEESNTIILSLSKQGELFLEGQKTSREQLAAELKKLLLAKKEATLVLEGDTSSDLGQVVELMDLARQAGATKLAISAQSK